MDEQPPAAADTDFSGPIHRYAPFSDYKLTCQNITFEVHKVILHLNSDFFSRAFSGDFQEGQSGSTSMPLPDESPDMVCAMLGHFYWRKYTVPTHAPVLTFHAKVLTIADKYGCDILVEAVCTELETAFNKQWAPEDFAEMARIVNDLPNTKLVDRVRTIAVLALRVKLPHQDAWLDSACIKQLLIDLPEWNVKLLKLMNQAAAVADYRSVLVGGHPGNQHSRTKSGHASASLLSQTTAEASPDHPSNTQESLEMKPTPQPNPILRGLHTIDDDLYSDNTLTCGTYTANIHRLVLQAHSTFFATTFTSSVREGQAGTHTMD